VTTWAHHFSGHQRKPPAALWLSDNLVNTCQSFKQLATELLPGRAVQEKVDGMVSVHEQICDDASQSVASLKLKVLLPLEVGRGYVQYNNGQGGQEKRERDGEKHDRKP